MKRVLLFYMLVLIVLSFSCKSNPYYSYSGENRISSFPVNDLQIISSGSLRYHKKKWSPFSHSSVEKIESLSENEIFIHGERQERSKIHLWIAGNEYSWEGHIRFKSVENKLYISFIKGYAETEIDSWLSFIEINTEYGKVKVKSKISNTVIESFPYKFAEFLTDDNLYTVYATVENFYSPKLLFSDKIPEAKPLSLDSSRHAINRDDQIFQILDGKGVVVAELRDDTYSIYSSLSSEKINSMKTCLGVLRTVIRISRELGCNSCNEAEYKKKNKINDNPPKTLF